MKYWNSSRRTFLRGLGVTMALPWMESIPTLVLGTEGSGGGTEAGYATLYSAHISWSSPTTPVPKEIYPRLAFDRLFNRGEHNRRNRTILDSVLAEAKSLQPHLSRHDQH